MFTLLPCLSVHWAFKNSKSLNKEINVHPKERSLDLLWVSEVLYCTHKVWRENHTRLHILVGREIIRSKNGFLSPPPPPGGPPKIWKSNFILNRATVRLKKGLLDLRKLIVLLSLRSWVNRQSAPVHGNESQVSLSPKAPSRFSGLIVLSLKTTSTSHQLVCFDSLLEAQGRLVETTGQGKTVPSPRLVLSTPVPLGLQMNVLSLAHPNS